MWKLIAGYGAALAASAIAMQWLDFIHLTRSYSWELYVALIAAGFLTLGIWAGAKVFGAHPPLADGNPAAQQGLGISPREMEVLREIANGLSTKEIAANLNVSPATVKTHIAKLFEKLEARRRTDAIAKARAMGLVP
jgi:DNA-binding CsgD family transcriptional regulator